MAQDFSKFMKFDYPNQTSRVTIRREDINEFVGMLHEVQLDYIDEAVELSNQLEAKVVLQHIMSLK